MDLILVYEMGYVVYWDWCMFCCVFIVLYGICVMLRFSKWIMFGVFFVIIGLISIFGVIYGELLWLFV